MTEEAPRKERKPRQARGGASEAELLIIEGAIKTVLQGTAGVLPMVTRDMRDGLVILQAEQALVDQIMAIARNDKAVRAYLMSLAQNSAYAGLLVVVVFKVVLPILDNHNMRPALFGRSEEKASPLGASNNGSSFAVSN